MADEQIMIRDRDGQDKMLDVEMVTRNGVAYLRQRMCLGGKDTTEVADVLAAVPPSTAYGAVTRNLPSGTQDTNPTDRTGRLLGQVEPRKASTATAPAQTAVGITAGQVLAANAARRSMVLQNTGTTVIKLVFGTTAPTQSVYHLALKGGVAADDGLGATYLDDQWTGAVQAISGAAGGTLVMTEIS